MTQPRIEHLACSLIVASARHSGESAMSAAGRREAIMRRYLFAMSVKALARGRAHDTKSFANQRR